MQNRKTAREWAKTMSMVGMPATMAGYFIISELLGDASRYGPVLGILSFVTLGFGVYVKKTAQYDGRIFVYPTNDEGGKLFSLELDDDPSGLEACKSVTFKIVSQKEHLL